MTNEANMEKLLADLKILSRDAEAVLQTTAGQAGDNPYLLPLHKVLKGAFQGRGRRGR